MPTKTSWGLHKNQFNNMLTADEYMSVNPRDNKDQFVKSQRYLGMYSSLSPRIALLIFVLQQMVYYLLPAEYQIIPIYLLSYSLSPPTAFFLCELAVSICSLGSLVWSIYAASWTIKVYILFISYNILLVCLWFFQSSQSDLGISLSPIFQLLATSCVQKIWAGLVEIEGPKRFAIFWRASWAFVLGYTNILQCLYIGQFFVYVPLTFSISEESLLFICWTWILISISIQLVLGLSVCHQYSKGYWSNFLCPFLTSTLWMMIGVFIGSLIN